MIKNNYILEYLSKMLLLVVFLNVLIAPLVIVFSDKSSEVIMDFKENTEENSTEEDVSDEDSNEGETSIGFLSVVDNYLFFIKKTTFDSPQILFKSLTQETFLPPPDLA